MPEVRSHRQQSKIIQRIEGPGIEPGATSNWSNELLPIPATVPSINSCRILNLSYAVVVTLDIPRAIDLHVTIPITMGNRMYHLEAELMLIHKLSLINQLDLSSHHLHHLHQKILIEYLL